MVTGPSCLPALPSPCAFPTQPFERWRLAVRTSDGKGVCRYLPLPLSSLFFYLVAELPLRYATARHFPFELEPLSSSRLDSLRSFSVSCSVFEFNHTRTLSQKTYEQLRRSTKVVPVSSGRVNLNELTGQACLKLECNTPHLPSIVVVPEESGRVNLNASSGLACPNVECRSDPRLHSAMVVPVESGRVKLNA